MRSYSSQIRTRILAPLNPKGFRQVAGNLTSLPLIAPRGAKWGFTLIELLVVIAVVAVIVSLTVVGLTSVRGKSRDSKRVGDIRQIQNALEMYYNANNNYPTAITFGNPIVDPGGVTYMAKVPSAPTTVDGSCTSDNNAYTYTYSASIPSSYSLTYCLGNNVSHASAGACTAGPGNICVSGGSGGSSGPSVAECAVDTCGDCSSLACGAVDFAFNGSCAAGTGQTFQAVKVGTQCWLDKAINIGTRINGSVEITTDATAGIKKWCYNDYEPYCTSDGGLYTWHMAMYLSNACNSSSSGDCAPSAYLTGSGASAKRQGICPKGWHLPSDYEWWYAEDYVQRIATPTGIALPSDDTGSGGDYYSDQIGSNGIKNAWRGNNDTTGSGAKLKPTGSSNLSLKLAGFRLYDPGDGEYTDPTWFAGSRSFNAAFWASSQYDTTNGWNRILSSAMSQTYRSANSKSGAGFTVSCIKD